MGADRQFVVDVLEEIFRRGLEIPGDDRLDNFICNEYQASHCLPTDNKLIGACIRKFRLTTYDQEMGDTISTTAGAGVPWLAVHEAGHAIVGLEFGFLLTGVRFFPNHPCGRPAGSTLFHNPKGIDEETVLKLISVDVAGNMAQLMTPGCDLPCGGLLSTLCDLAFDPLTRYPTDFICANRSADKFMTPITTCTDAAVIEREFRARKPLFVSAEALTTKILDGKRKVIKLLAERFMFGPMTGTAIRSIAIADAVAVP